MSSISSISRLRQSRAEPCERPANGRDTALTYKILDIFDRRRKTWLLAPSIFAKWSANIKGRQVHGSGSHASNPKVLLTPQEPVKPLTPGSIGWTGRSRFAATATCPKTGRAQATAQDGSPCEVCMLLAPSSRSGRPYLSKKVTSPTNLPSEEGADGIWFTKLRPEVAIQPPRLHPEGRCLDWRSPDP